MRLSRGYIFPSIVHRVAPRVPLRSLSSSSSSAAYVSLSSEEEVKAKAITERWVRQWVFKNGLCPWAGKVLNEKTLRYEVVSAPLREITDTVEREIDFLFDEKNKIDTTLLILTQPALSKSFSSYLDLVEHVESFLEERELDEVVQVATFHPRYQFAGTQREDVENYTNCSPYPMLHLLKVEQVTAAIDALNGDTERVWKRNVELMKSMGAEKIQQAHKDIIELQKD